MQPVTEENPDEETVFSAPLEPGAASPVLPDVIVSVDGFRPYRRADGPPIMDASYRLGVSIVLGTVIVSAGLCLRLSLLGRPETVPARTSAGGRSTSARSGWSSARAACVTDADLADRVWVAAFIFTRCPMSCPRITSVMKGLQGKLAGTGVQLVSLSVDPEYDTPEVLADFARRYGADPDRWWFLTGPKADVERLIVERFKLGLETSGATTGRRERRRSCTAHGWRWSIGGTRSSATSIRTTPRRSPSCSARLAAAPSPHGSAGSRPSTRRSTGPARCCCWRAGR